MYYAIIIRSNFNLWFSIQSYYAQQQLLHSKRYETRIKYTHTHTYIQIKYMRMYVWYNLQICLIICSFCRINKKSESYDNRILVVVFRVRAQYNNVQMQISQIKYTTTFM